MRKLLYAFGLTSALVFGLAAHAAAPNFAGTWTLDKSKSQGLNQRIQNAESVSWTITQTDKGFQYGVDGTPSWNAKPFVARVGETQIWTLINETPWSHPFHLHGFFFQVLDEKDEPVRPLAWKDTVNVPYKKSLRVVVRFDDRPGVWMFHCHILDHADGGLMGNVQVGIPPSGLEFTPLSHRHP